MNSNLEATLIKYYKGKLRAEMNCAIMKSRNEVLTKHLQRMQAKEKSNKSILNSINEKIGFINKNMIDNNNSIKSQFKSLEEKVQKNLNELEQKLIPDEPMDRDNTINIWEAAEKGSLPGVKYYLAQNPSNLSKINRDYYNYHPLHYAAREGHLHIVQYLLSKGAEIDSLTSYNSTPLMLASLNGDLSVINLLIEKGANINHQNAQKNTPLHFAVLENKLDAVKHLIDRGAYETLENNNDQTPLEFANSINHSSIVHYLSQL